MECKNCHAPLEEGAVVCPACGAAVEEANQTPEVAETPVETVETPAEAPVETAEAPAEAPVEAAEAPAELPPVNKRKVALLAVIGTVIVAAVVLLVLWATGVIGGSKAPETPDADPTETTASQETTLPAGTDGGDATQPSAFQPTMTEEEAKAAMQTVVGRIGTDTQLTNGQVSVSYWMNFYEFASQLANYYGIDVSAFGLDVNQPLSQQECYMGVEGQTWEDYFLEQALQLWTDNTALADYCTANGITLSAEDQANIDGLAQSMADNAAAYGFASADEMLQADFGYGVTLEDYVSFIRVMMLANQYYIYQEEQLDVSEEVLTAYYNDNPELFAENGLEQDNSPSLVNVRHILIVPEGDKDASGAYTQEQMAQAREQAQALLDQWAAGEATEESFAALAGEHTQDPGSKQTGGLYEDVYPGQMVDPFNDWCFNPIRQPGDTGLVQTTYGIHVMYFSAVTDPTPHWLATVKDYYVGNTINEMAAQVVDSCPADIDRSAIVLSEVDLASAY